MIVLSGTVGLGPDSWYSTLVGGPVGYSTLLGNLLRALHLLGDLSCI